MSFRSWLGEGTLGYTDFDLKDYASVRDLCNEAKWLLPCKVFSPTPELLMEFLECMELDHSMHPKDVHCYLKEGKQSEARHIPCSTIEEAEQELGVKRKIIEE